jgi:hypothetical protein
VIAVGLADGFGLALSEVVCRSWVVGRWSRTGDIPEIVIKCVIRPEVVIPGVSIIPEFVLPEIVIAVLILLYFFDC